MTKNFESAIRQPAARILAQIQLLQLGRAQGRVINHGIEWQTAFLAFALTFAFACATVIFMSRITHGWRMAALADQQTAG